MIYDISIIYLHNYLLYIQLYHPGTDHCWPALDQGPCGENQWLAPSNLTTGEVDIYNISTYNT